jgi:hypothetical protein
MPRIPMTIKPIHTGTDRVSMLINAAYDGLSDEDKQCVDRQVSRLSQAVYNMGEKGALELCYALGCFLNDPEKYLGRQPGSQISKNRDERDMK